MKSLSPWWDVCAVLALAVAFRLPALLADFWFDEIYSLERFALQARSVNDILFADALKHDNNHQLNTLVLYLLGSRAHWLLYRIPGAICGLVAVGTAVVIGQRRGRQAGFVTGALVAMSYFMAVYSTEARGYPWVLASAGIAYIALENFLASGSRRTAMAFWLALALGLAAHPAMLHVYLGALLWSGYRLRNRPNHLVWLHLVPMAWIALWLVFVTRGSLVGGGPPWTWSTLVDEAFAWTVGYPLGLVPAAVAATAALALLAWDAWSGWQEDSDDGLFFIGAILGPVILIVALSPPYLFPRYFIVPLFFLLLVAARRLSSFAQVSPARQWMTAAVLLAFATGNGMHLRALMEQRHGNHAAAVQLMAAIRPGPSVPGPGTHDSTVTVASWSLDQWTVMPLDFYAQRLDLAALEYVSREELRRRPVGAPQIDWAVDATQPCARTPDRRRRLPGSDREYVLVRSFPVCGPSGMSWHVYAPASAAR